MRTLSSRMLVWSVGPAIHKPFYSLSTSYLVDCRVVAEDRQLEFALVLCNVVPCMKKHGTSLDSDFEGVKKLVLGQLLSLHDTNQCLTCCQPMNCLEQSLSAA